MRSPLPSHCPFRPQGTSPRSPQHPTFPSRPQRQSGAHRARPLRSCPSPIRPFGSPWLRLARSRRSTWGGGQTTLVVLMLRGKRACTIDLRQLRPGKLGGLWNSTLLGAATSESRVRRNTVRADWPRLETRSSRSCLSVLPKRGRITELRLCLSSAPTCLPAAVGGAGGAVYFFGSCCPFSVDHAIGGRDGMNVSIMHDR